MLFRLRCGVPTHQIRSGKVLYCRSYELFDWFVCVPLKQYYSVYQYRILIMVCSPILSSNNNNNQFSVRLYEL